MITLQWDLYGKFSPVPDAGFDTQRPADCSHPLLHGDESQALSTRYRMSPAGVEALAVVPDRTTQHKVFSPRTNPDMIRLCMFDGIG